MKLTFTDLQQQATDTIGLTDAATMRKVRRDINYGATLFLASLGREYNRKSRFTDMENGVQYYQLPEDGLRLKEIIVNTGGWEVPLEQIPDEHAWRMMNMMSVSGLPTHYFIRGNDEVGLYPIPSETTPEGIELVFSPKHVVMTEEDFTTGTVTVTNGIQTVTHSATGFTEKMVGSWIEITDGTDGNWYRIAEVTSTSVLELENFYQGTSGVGKTFRIGQVPDMPEEFLEALADYACYKRFKARGQRQDAADFLALYKEAIDGAKNAYGQMTDSQVIYAEPNFRTYNPFRGDPPPSISA